MSIVDLAVEERRDLLEFARGLAPAEWEAQSLCSEWRVRDVVAHVFSYDTLQAPALVRRFAQGRFWLSKINKVGVDEAGSRTPEELIALLEQNLRPSGAMTAFGGRIALTDGLIHHQDIRRPLGKPRDIPPDRLRQALNFGLVAPPVRGAWRLRGVRAIATDIDWSFGAGAEVRGLGEAILMTMAGRRGIAGELEGPGAPRLQQRIG